METGNSQIALVKEDDNSSCIYFQDKALSTYLYIKNFEYINLEKKEILKEFMKTVLSDDAIMSLSDLYITYLRHTNPEKVEELKHGDAFELNEVFDSFSSDLQEDVNKNGVVFYLQNKKSEIDYEDTNPLKEIIEKNYMKDFFNGLKFSYSEKVLFVLAMANQEWGWLFPDFKDEEYKSHLFCHICELDIYDEIAYSRKINSKLIKLGLFSSPWTINSFVYSYFKDENPAFSFQYVKPWPCCDIYNYKKIAELNRTSLDIIKKLPGFTAICGESDYRNKYFLADFFQNFKTYIYELTPEYGDASKTELEFYIYALSLKLKNQILFLNNSIVKKLLREDSKNPIENPFHKNQESTSILSNVECRVILSMENFDQESRSKLQQEGIDVLYNMKLKLPEEKNYLKNFMYFCLEENTPYKFLQVIGEECQKLEIKPEEWKS
ncbi:MAG: hypothetical protein K6E78_06255, partial [Treponema sp.]|nr:hypothetical protein [Treponema sp.]